MAGAAGVAGVAQGVVGDARGWSCRAGRERISQYIHGSPPQRFLRATTASNRLIVGRIKSTLCASSRAKQCHFVLTLTSKYNTRNTVAGKTGQHFLWYNNTVAGKTGQHFMWPSRASRPQRCPHRRRGPAVHPRRLFDLPQGRSGDRPLRDETVRVHKLLAPAHLHE